MVQTIKNSRFWILTRRSSRLDKTVSVHHFLSTRTQENNLRLHICVYRCHLCFFGLMLVSGKYNVANQENIVRSFVAI
jgi:hypothetical protein